MLKALFTILYLAIAVTVWAGEIVLSGSYQGKDIYVQNPFDQTTKKFCTGAVYVNDRMIFDQPRISAYRINLSHLSINDLVVIRITYSEGCKPRIINPQVLKNVSAFKFLTTETDHNAITWMTEGEEGGAYYVEQQNGKAQWRVVDTVDSKERAHVNSYTIRAPHHKGENRYRVRYRDDVGQEAYSLESAFTKSDRITFYPSVATTTLTLSDSTAFVITDFYGKEIKKGRGIEIYVQDLRPGEYYLNIQNRKEKFVKK